jgi:hypothetical protein
MASLNLTTKEFSDLALIYLFDQVMNPDQVTNEHSREFIDAYSARIKTGLMKYYLDSDSSTRVMYKRIKGVFDGSDNNVHQIRIRPDESIEDKEEEKEEGKLKKIAKKIIKKILSKEDISLEERNILNEFIGGNDNG